MQGCLTKLRILFHCLLDGGQFTLTRSESNRERRGAAPFCHRRTTSESFWSRSDSGPHRSA